MAPPRKSVLITGCSGRGIGNHLAKVFNDRGFHVIATARQSSSISDLASAGISTVSLTVDDPESVRSCYKEVEGLLEGKGLDYLYHNAGQNYTVPTTDIVVSEAKAMFNTNLFAVMDINSVFLPLLIRSKGTIVATGSVAGIMPFWFGSAYNCSKAALRSYLDTLRVELAPFEIHVVNVITAGVVSEIARTKRALPEGSIFVPWAEMYQSRLVESQTRGMDTQQYADYVVPKVVNSRGRLWNQNEVWAGRPWQSVYILDLINNFFPGGVWRLYVGYVVGLRKRKD